MLSHRGPAWLEPRTVPALLVVGYVLTRIVLIEAAGSGTYLSHSADLQLYEGYADDLLSGAWPYRDLVIEYPPLIMPVLIVPTLLPADLLGGYIPGFIAMMFVLDAVAFAAITHRARQGGAWSGPVTWLVGPLLLGPLVYHRLDMVVAVVSVIAVARLASSPSSSVGWLVLGAAAKFHPAALIPPVLAGLRRRWRAVGIGLLVAAAALAPFAFDLRDLWRSTVGYHLQRGIQAESSWAVLDLAGGLFLDHEISWGYVAESRSEEVWSSWTGLFEVAAPLLTVIAIAWVTWRVARADRDASTIARACYAAAALVLVVGSVFSPQFVLWLIALAAVALTYPVDAAARRALLLVLPVAAVTHLSFVVFGTYTRPVDLAVLAGRNALVAWSGWTIVRGLERRGAGDG